MDVSKNSQNSIHSPRNKDEIIERVEENGRSLKTNIITRKLQYFGHMIRSDRTQKTPIEGKVKEKRQRGRRRRT